MSGAVLAAELTVCLPNKALDVQSFVWQTHSDGCLHHRQDCGSNVPKQVSISGGWSTVQLMSVPHQQARQGLPRTRQESGASLRLLTSRRALRAASSLAVALSRSILAFSPNALRTSVVICMPSCFLQRREALLHNSMLQNAMSTKPCSRDTHIRRMGTILLKVRQLSNY